jgi:hypothetical protein
VLDHTRVDNLAILVDTKRNDGQLEPEVSTLFAVLQFFLYLTFRRHIQSATSTFDLFFVPDAMIWCSRGTPTSYLVCDRDLHRRKKNESVLLAHAQSLCRPDRVVILQTKETASTFRAAPSRTTIVFFISGHHHVMILVILILVVA